MPESFEKLLAVAEVYAKALYELAAQAGRVEPIRAELALLAGLCQREPEFAAFMASGAVDDDRRAESLERMFRGRLCDEVVNTLQVMNRHGRAGLLRELHRCFVLLLERAAGQIEVTAVSAVELTPEQRQAVTRAAAEISGRKPVMEFRVEPGIIGGLILEIGDERYDASVRRRLASIRARLRERAERGLEAGASASAVGSG